MALVVNNLFRDCHGLLVQSVAQYFAGDAGGGRGWAGPGSPDIFLCVGFGRWCRELVFRGETGGCSVSPPYPQMFSSFSNSLGS